MNDPLVMAGYWLLIFLSVVWAARRTGRHAARCEIAEALCDSAAKSAKADRVAAHTYATRADASAACAQGEADRAQAAHRAAETTNWLAKSIATSAGDDPAVTPTPATLPFPKPAPEFPRLHVPAAAERRDGEAK